MKKNLAKKCSDCWKYKLNKGLCKGGIENCKYFTTEERKARFHIRKREDIPALTFNYFKSLPANKGV